MDVRLPDGTIVKNVPEGTTQAELMGRVNRMKAERLVQGDAITRGAQNFNEDTGFWENVAAGAGKAVSDIGLGVRQIVGNASQEEVDEVGKRDRALMSTGGGLTGNIGTQIGTALLPAGALARAPGAIGAAGKLAMTAPSTLAGAMAGAGMGAGQAALQPVQTGESRGSNALVGAMAGAAVPVAGMGLRAAKGAVEPLYQGGRNQILGRAMRAAAGSGADDAARNMAAARELVPGSLPTAGETAQSGGIAAMQRAASAVDPESYATRAAQQNEARVSSLLDLAGTSGQREFFDASRKEAAAKLYKEAYDKGVDILRDPISGQYLPKAQIAGVRGEITKLLQRPAIQDALTKARTLAANEGVKISNPAGSIKGLDYVKRALDDNIASAVGNEQRVLVDLKNRLLTTIDRLSPSYAQARTTFTEMSKPINQMDIAQEIADKSINKLTGNIQPQSFARQLSDETAQRATGFGKATLEGTLEPQQLQLLNALKADLARSVAARDLGRGAGSDTVQKLSMTNLMRQSGLPTGLQNLPGVGRVGNFAYQSADDKMMAQLAQTMLDPKAAAALMQGAVPSAQKQALAEALRRAGSAGLIGTTMTSLNAQ